MKRYSFYIFCFLSLILLVGCQSQTHSMSENSRHQTNNRVSFVAVGDNLMHKSLIDSAYNGKSYDFMSYYQNVKSDIEKADLSFVNQETILGGKDLGYSGYPLFNTPDEMAETLHDVGFDVVNGATNHAFDMKEKGIKHSLDVFQNYQDMAYIGLYQSQDDYEHITVINKNHIRIAFLSYNQYTNGNSVPHHYTYHSFDKEQMKNDIEKAKEVSDVIVVSCHWGKEYDIQPNAFQKEYAQFLADQGVDVIIGTHSHTLQPIEWIEGENGHKTLVAYSLGNFISGMTEKETQLGGMLSFDFVKDDDKVQIENVTLTPLVNHYNVKNKKQLLSTRYGFTVYRLKDYTEELASQHGLNGYKEITISKEDMIEKVYQRINEDIKIDV